MTDKHEAQDKEVLYRIFRTWRRDSTTAEALSAKDYGLRACRISVSHRAT